MSVYARLPSFEFAQSLPPFGFRLPARMSVLVFGERKLALVSPIPIDDALAAELAKLGEVAYLIAPNLLHHLYLGAACKRYPQARVLAPAALQKKRPELSIFAPLEAGLPIELAGSVELLHIDGAAAIDEFVFYHRAQQTLVVTDLVFNVVRPAGWFTQLVLSLVGCNGCLGSSRVWRMATKDRRAARASIERILALPFQTLVVAHGEPVEEAARSELARALAWLLPARTALPAQ